MGGGPGTHDNVIDRVSFTTDGIATDVGDLLAASQDGSGSSSTAYGYHACGGAPGTYTNTLQKFSVTSDGNSTDVGNMTVAIKFTGGCQY